jgi:hypothetical protein
MKRRKEMMDMEWFTAKSYENWERVGQPYEKSGKMYSKAKAKCDRCSGHGIVASRVENGVIIPIPVDGGICYKCLGRGYEEKEIRLYTEKERATLDRQAERRNLKAQEKLEAEKAEKLAKSEENKKIWFEQNGFSAEGITYAIVGDTYAIKDWLKENGYKFNPLLKWHGPEELMDLPEGYQTITFAFDDLYEWQPTIKMACAFEDAKQKVEKAFAQAEGPSLSEYMGEVGDRLRNITAIYISTHGFQGQFGYTNIHSFKSGENVLVWFTTKDLKIEKGALIDLTGTVNLHEEFCGVKTTRINRCIIKVLEE